MERYLEKIIALAIIYGIIMAISKKGVQNELLRFGCALGMLIAIMGIKPYIKEYGYVLKGHSSEIEYNIDKGQEIFNIQLNQRVTENIENGINEIAMKYGKNCETEVHLNVTKRGVDLTEIKIYGNFPSQQGVGFMKNEIIKTYGKHEVTVIEK